MGKTIITSSIMEEMIDDSIEELIKTIKEKDNDIIFYFYGRSNGILIAAYIGGGIDKTTYENNRKMIYNIVKHKNAAFRYMEEK